MLSWQWYSFQQMSLEQLYQLLKLRAEIFVYEQVCPYVDPDGKDPAALHLLGMEHGEIKAALRLFTPTKETPFLLFGRVVTHASLRGQGFGRELMARMMAYCEIHYPNIPIQCSAQAHLQKFYESFGFEREGEVYDEDGIDHIKTVYQASLKRNIAAAANITYTKYGDYLFNTKHTLQGVKRGKFYSFKCYPGRKGAIIRSNGLV